MHKISFNSTETRDFHTKNYNIWKKEHNAMQNHHFTALTAPPKPRFSHCFTSNVFFRWPNGLPLDGEPRVEGLSLLSPSNTDIFELP